MNMPEGDELQEVTVRRMGKEGSEIALFEFQGKLRELMISELRTGYHGRSSFTPGTPEI